ncbi:MAG: sigma-70 family RNA polymerase sigma factor [Haloferula sp.]
MKRAISGREDLCEWISLYWYPLYTWARRKGWSPEDAADEVQEFLGKICSRNLLSTADPARGKLRSWLLTSFGNHLANSHARSTRLKRGGGALHFSIDLPSAEAIYQNEGLTSDNPEQAYSRAWALTLMEEALDRLSRDHERSGRSELFEALLPALEQPFEGSSYNEVAEILGMTPAALRQASVRFRQRYRRTLLDLAGERLGITDEALLEEELRGLLGS